MGELLDAARWCKVNDHELATLAGPGEPVAAPRRLIVDHHLAQVFVTLGAAGAFSLTADGRVTHVAPDRNATVVDTVGAGDAFASVLVAGLLEDWPLPLTLDHAQQLASAVCGQRGALPRESGFYEELAGRWDKP